MLTSLHHCKVFLIEISMMIFMVCNSMTLNLTFSSAVDVKMQKWMPCRDMQSYSISCHPGNSCGIIV